ncbi:hypothetical protein K438DRAFT_1958811 [Mycena galopus ATCC 62051]|nr:hypothetical protein K438DRAFT_1958811 [Mycena galopus ATCC 62051]
MQAAPRRPASTVALALCPTPTTFCCDTNESSTSSYGSSCLSGAGVSSSLIVGANLGIACVPVTTGVDGSQSCSGSKTPLTCCKALFDTIGIDCSSASLLGAGVSHSSTRASSSSASSVRSSSSSAAHSSSSSAHSSSVTSSAPRSSSVSTTHTSSSSAHSSSAASSSAAHSSSSGAHPSSSLFKHPPQQFGLFLRSAHELIVQRTLQQLFILGGSLE